MGGKGSAHTRSGQQVSILRIVDRTCGGVAVKKPKGVKVSGLSGAESVMGKRKNPPITVTVWCS